jgi:predicted dehydrogenase
LHHEGRPLRWGILGAARINELVVPACRASDELAFVAVASRDADRARAHADLLGIPGSYGSYEQLLACEAVDAVYVPLPNALHVEWTTRALEAGKHVLCEKPFTSSPEAATAAFELAERRGLVLAEAFMYRFHPQTQLVRELVRGGRIGELAVMHAEHSFLVEDVATDFRTAQAMEGGALMDLGCYCVSTARMLAGEPERVSATALSPDGAADMRFVAALAFPGDVVATFDCALDLPLRAGLEIVGTRGSIVLDDPWHCRTGSISVRDEAGKAEQLPVPPIDRYRAQFEAFSRAVTSGVKLEFGQADAVAQAAAMQRLRDAAQLPE